MFRQILPASNIRNTKVLKFQVQFLLSFSDSRRDLYFSLSQLSCCLIKEPDVDESPEFQTSFRGSSVLL